MSAELRIACIVDNMVQHGSACWGEHGLAYLIEAEGRRLLFDTGQTGSVLLHNLRAMRIEPASLEALAISHAHYDHTGGLQDLLSHVRPGIPVYAHPDLFRERLADRAGKHESIGIPLPRAALAARATLRLSSAPQEILPGIWTEGEITQRPEPEGRSASHLVREGIGLIPDPYRDDLSLVLMLPSGSLLLCGCCHAGLLNTLAHVQRSFGQPVVAIAGGTHLVGATPGELQHVGEVLASLASLRRVCLNHCSGVGALLALTQGLGSAVVHLSSAGTQLDAQAFL